MLGSLLLLAAAPSPTILPAEIQVAIWVRAPADYAAGQDPGPVDHRVIGLSQVNLRDEARYDLQYGRKERYLGLELLTLIQQHPQTKAHNLALLHFENGMLIPLPYRDAGAMARLDAFVAVRRWSDEDQRFHAELPGVEHGGPTFLDRRPTEFRGLKVVVDRPWHPFLRDSASSTFSPWLHADTLEGIELVDEKAWNRQFEVDGDGRVKRGQERFKESCLWCHSARGIGGHYGWDMMEPVPVTTFHANVTSLYYHVRFRAEAAREQGQLMPGLKHMGEPEVGDIWHWLKAMAAGVQPAYTPKR